MSYLGKTPVDVVDALNVQSLTVDNNLTVDTDTLVVDSTNNRVGIGTSSPYRTLTVSGDQTTEGLLEITSATPQLLFSVPSGGLDSRIHNDGSGNFIFGTGTNSPTPTERMRITSSGLNVTGSLTQSAGLVPNYDSGYVSFGGTSTTTVSHGLGTRPSICIITMYCNSSNAGYSTGDELVVCHDDGDGGRRHIGYWNSSQVIMRWNNSGMVNPTVGISNWSAGSWRYRVRCWK